MPTENENVFERISNEYYNLTASEKKLADYILGNQSGTQFLTISKLAEVCEVAEATVSRFCRRLGYDGFNAFKLAVANCSVQYKPWNNPLSGEIQEEDSLEDVCKKLYSAEVEAITQTTDLIDLEALSRAVDILKNARRVICMGQGGSMIIAEEACHLFSTVTNKFIAVSDSHIQAMYATSVDPEDVIFFFSYSGSTKTMIHTLKLANERECQIIMMTRFPKSPGAAMADVVLQCGSNENPLQSGSVAARMAQLYLLDVLVSEYSRRDMDQCRKFRTRIADALADEHL